MFCATVGEGVDDDGLGYQEALAYRVVQVNEADDNDLDLPVNQQGNNAVQVLTSPINGQFYVIGNANDVFTTAQTSRSISPRLATIQIETPRNSGPGVKKVRVVCVKKKNIISILFSVSLKDAKTRLVLTFFFKFDDRSKSLICLVLFCAFRGTTGEEQRTTRSSVDVETRSITGLRSLAR